MPYTSNQITKSFGTAQEYASREISEIETPEAMKATENLEMAIEDLHKCAEDLRSRLDSILSPAAHENKQVHEDTSVGHSFLTGRINTLAWKIFLIRNILSDIKDRSEV